MRGRKLVLRIYLIGLAQMAALAATLAIVRAARPEMPPSYAEERRFLIEEITSRAADPALLAARLRELKARTGIEVALLDRNGSVVAASGPVQTAGPGSVSVPWSGGTAWTSIRLPSPPPGVRGFAIAATLVLVGISALLTAAWLGKPLAALSAAARELGAGNLDARARLHRQDELGDVAGAFNEMAERIEHLVRGQRELLANVSHELRTPLARIRVALDLAAEGSAQDAAAHLQGIAGDLAELERLTGDILTSARLELSTAKPPLRVERIPAHELIADASDRFRTAHPDRELRVEEISADAQVDADRMLLRRVLDNLLENAAKYSSAAITLHATSSDGRLAVEVRDSGAGISPEDMASLFTPFFRADRSRTRWTGGLGLGLLLSRRIVEAHRGTLEIESAVGRGTTVRIRVPLSGR
jgi:two-component system OmpR family sensor kinase